MSFQRRSERNRENYFRGYRAHVTRPAALDKPVCTYCTRYSRVPEQIRLSFEDGTTAIYLLKVDQPSPIVRR